MTNIFTSCAPTGSLLEAIAEAAKRARYSETRHSAFARLFKLRSISKLQTKREGACRVLKSIGRGAPGGGPYIHGKQAGIRMQTQSVQAKAAFDPEFLEGKLRTTRINHSS